MLFGCLNYLRRTNTIKNYVSQLYETPFQNIPWTTYVSTGHRQYYCVIRTTLLALRSCRCSTEEENDTKLLPFICTNVTNAKFVSLSSAPLLSDCPQRVEQATPISGNTRQIQFHVLRLEHLLSFNNKSSLLSAALIQKPPVQ